jgi:hypothetical protein
MSSHRRLTEVQHVLLIGLTIFLTMLAVPATAYAGNGTFKNGEFNFCVSVRFNATDAQLQQIRTAFQNGSQILSDATDGQHRFGEIAIVNNSGASESADYWVNAGPGRAYATFGQYGVRGEHVMLYFDSNFQAVNGADGDAYTVAHEHAHHAYGVADEYSGPGFLGIGSTAAECALTPDTAGLSFCLMDNYFTRGGRFFGLGYTLNEFCVAGNHDPNNNTFQESRNHESCWETIASHPKRSASSPVGLPIDAAPAAGTVNFEDGVAGLRVVLVLDRSGSMAAEDRLTFAKRGANLFIDFLRTGDAIGVVSFDSAPTVNFPLTTIGAGTQSSAKAAVNGVALGGATNIGGGLQAALNLINAQAGHSCNTLIVLLSDGDHNTGTPPDAVIPALQDAGVAVLSVGVGAGISTSGEAALQNVASQTAGKFYRVSGAFSLVGLFLRLSMESIGSGLLTSAPEPIATGQTKETQVFVESGAGSATFALTFANSADVINLSLMTPSGNVITPADAGVNPNIKFLTGTNSKAFIINAPEPGVWKILSFGELVVGGQIEVLAFASQDGVQLGIGVNKDNLMFPEAVEIQATPRFGGESVVGAIVSGIVTRPDGSKVPITLFDDGLAEHADTVESDGIYAARFNNYNDDGTYTFDINVVVANGKTFAGENLFLFTPSNENSVPAFTRSASATAIVTGVPDFVPATVEFGPETINLKSQGNSVTAYIELPAGFDPADIVVSTIGITAIDGVSVNTIMAKTQPTQVGDFDNDGIPDFMVKFSRSSIQEVLSSGVREIRVEGFVAGQLFVGTRSVRVIH